MYVRRGPSQPRVSRYGAALVDGVGCEKGSIAAESEQVRGCVGRSLTTAMLLSLWGEDMAVVEMRRGAICTFRFLRSFSPQIN